MLAGFPFRVTLLAINLVLSSMFITGMILKEVCGQSNLKGFVFDCQFIYFNEQRLHIRLCSTERVRQISFFALHKSPLSFVSTKDWTEISNLFRTKLAFDCVDDLTSWLEADLNELFVFHNRIDLRYCLRTAQENCSELCFD